MEQGVGVSNVKWNLIPRAKWVRRRPKYGLGPFIFVYFKMTLNWWTGTGLDSCGLICVDTGLSYFFLKKIIFMILNYKHISICINILKI